MRGRTPANNPAAFLNAVVHTLDPARSQAAGILVAGERVDKLFETTPAGFGREVGIFDCAGAAIVPGLHDCHMHLTATGLLAGDRDLSACGDIPALLRTVGSFDDPLIYAGKYQDDLLAEKRPPSRQELDAAQPDRPLLLSRIDGHSCIVNSAALQRLDVAALDTVERDASGEPTGRLFASAAYEGQRRFLSMLPDATLRAADRRAADAALEAGITTVHNVIEGDYPLETLQSLYRSDSELPLRVISKSCTTDVAKVKRLGARIFGGDIFVDGSIGSMTAALRAPYSGAAQSGLLYLDRQQLGELFEEAASAGLSLGVHAIGDSAIEEAIAAWEAVIARRGSLAGVRPSIDHFEIASPDHISRAAACGIFLSMQPAFDALWGGESGMYARRLGTQRAAGMNRLRSALHAGCIVCSGSDSPVTPFSALYGIQSAVLHHAADERLSLEQALRSYTADAARLAFRETSCGALRPGMLADFAILERDPFAVPSDRISNIGVLATVVGGRIAHAKHGTQFHVLPV